MNLRAQVDLHGGVRDWVPMVLKQMVLMKVLRMKVLRMKVLRMKDDQRKRDGWMDDQNLGDRNRGAVVSHPFRAPLFRFSFNAFRQIEFYC
jgi:hypothetical protein